MTDQLISLFRYSPIEIVTTGTITTFSSHDSSCYVFTGAGAVTIESISYGAKGKILKFINLTGNTLTIKHNTGSINKNKVITSNASDLVIANNQVGNLVYDHINSRWKVDGAASGGGGGAFTSLSDVPSSYSGQTLKGVRVNAGENGLEFYTPGSGNLKTTLLIYTATPSADNEYSNFNTLHTAALSLVADGFSVEIKLLQNLTISTGNDWDFKGMIFIGNGSAFSPITFIIEDTTGTQATFELTAGSATPANYFEHYVSLYDDENLLSYIWFDTTGADPEPPAIISEPELKVRVDVSAIASADDVATAIQTAISGDTYLNDKFTVVPTAAVAAFTLNWNGVSTLPVSSTANITVGSFINGVLGTTLLPYNILHLRNISFAFNNYNTQRAWKVDSDNPYSIIIIDAIAESNVPFSYANSTSCSVSPVEILTTGRLFVIQSGLTSIFNIVNNLFVFINGGNLSLFPENSLFGYGPGSNITGSTGSVYIKMGRDWPQSPRDDIQLVSFTGSITADVYQYLHIADVQGIPSLVNQGSLLYDNGNREVATGTTDNILGIGKVDAYADSNINIATLNNSVPIDGLSLSNPSKVYLGAQTNPVENGAYIVTDTAPATRDYSNFSIGNLYKISGGNTHAGKWIKNTNILPFTLDTDAITQQLTLLSNTGENYNTESRSFGVQYVPNVNRATAVAITVNLGAVSAADVANGLIAGVSVSTNGSKLIGKATQSSETTVITQVTINIIVGAGKYYEISDTGDILSTIAEVNEMFI
jgi:hypothetical protein